MMKTNKNINFALNSRKGDREYNEDSLMCCYNKSNEYCAIVCDGVGSVVGSKTASQLVCDIYTKEFAKLEYINDPIRWAKEILVLCLKQLAIVEKEKNAPGISTTLAMLIITRDGKYYSFNIGDTRIYKIDEKDAKIISFDHNYKNYLIRQEASIENIEAAKSKWHSLTNYIDASRPQAARFEVNSGEIHKKIMFVLCTDGLYNSFDCNQLHQIVWDKPLLPITLKSLKLMRYCYKKDRSDNLSSIIISVK